AYFEKREGVACVEVWRGDLKQYIARQSKKYIEGQSDVNQSPTGIVSYPHQYTLEERIEAQTTNRKVPSVHDPSAPTAPLPELLPALPTPPPPPDAPPPSRPAGFTTARGSSYEFHDDGTTTRTKAPRPEHPGDFGVKERSVRTVYVDPADAPRF